MIAALLASKPGGERLAANLAHVMVEEMDDGGMGSLRFVDDSVPERLFGEALVDGEFADEDGVPVRIGVFLDRRGELFELDVWKVDFSPLKRFPSPDRISIER